jgi:prepilin-type N-terminal cleavage/methylation domain-containing protein
MLTYRSCGVGLKKLNGFSLIELLVVIAIVGLLAAIAVPSYKNYQTRAKLSQAMTFFAGLQKQSEAYYATKGVYPTAANLGYAVSGATFTNPRTYLPFASAITLDTAGVSGKCAGKMRGAASITLDTSLINVSNAGSMYYQWGESAKGTFVSFCNDNSPTNNDWVGTTCTYTTATTQQFFDSLCP